MGTEEEKAFVIPPKNKIDVLELREHLLKQNSKITHEVLHEYSLEILELYRDIYKNLTNPPQKILTNTDGHLFIPHKMLFEIEDAMSAFESLHSLDFNDSREDLLEMAKFDQKKQLKLVEFPWLKKGNKKHKTWDNTVWGHIKIEPHKMTVEVNSAERAKKFKNELKKLMPTGWKLKTTLIEPIEAQLKEAKNHQTKDILSKDHEELSNDPQVKEHMEKMMKAHWKTQISL